ncbi:MAG: hypothetical protein OXC83_02230 [Chloroflexi bacterium]|nr:hypothetical protein [Chloroflexota bacterium]
MSTQADEIANSFEGRRYYGFGWVWRRLVAGLVDWLLVVGWVLGCMCGRGIEACAGGVQSFVEGRHAGASTVWVANRG